MVAGGHRYLAATILMAMAVSLASQLPAPTGGLALLKEGRFDEAAAELGQEVRRKPDDPGLRAAWVKSLVEGGRWIEALAAAKETSDRAPANPEARLMYGDCLFLDFRAEEALAVWRPVLQDARWRVLALPKMVNAALALGRKREALSLIAQAEAEGIPPTADLLSLKMMALDDPSAKLAVLKAIGRIGPDSQALADQVRLYEALAPAGPVRIDPPARFPGSARMREIYGEPSLRVTIDGKKSWLALDTGAESVLVNADLARKLRLPELAPASIEGWGYQGPRQSLSVLISRLEVAGMTVTQQPAVINVRDSEFWTNKGGYLGLSPFAGFVTYYDRRHGRFALWPKGTPPDRLLGEKGTTLPLLWVGGVPLVQVGLQGRGPFPFLLDTGAPYTLLASQYVPKLGIRINSGKYGNLYGIGFSGAFSSGLAEQVTLEFAGRVFHEPVAPVTQVPQRFPLPLWGILGRDILNRYRMVFDGPGNTVTLVPYPDMK
jgi:tetratricopeptide (TPR) repeat protein